MNLPLRQSLLLLLLASTMVACNRTLDPTPEHLESSFPIQEGKHRIYHVIDTSYYSTTGTPNVKTYFRMEKTEGFEEDLLGRNVSKLWLYTSPDTIQGGSVYEWTFSQLWSQYLGATYAERMEGNQRRLVLKVPPYKSSTWNGNLYNNLDAQTYRYLSLDSTVLLNGKTYEHCVVVLQAEFREAGGPTLPFHSIEYAYEVYAPYVGKIERFEKYYEAQNGSVVPSKSFVLHEVIVDHNY